MIVDGLFVALEGLDGSGKSTQIPLVKARLEDLGYMVVTTKEPGGTPLGQNIRELFMRRHGEMTPFAEVALLLAAKSQMLEHVVYPALAMGRIVLCDRFTDTLLAYQVGGLRYDSRMVYNMLTAGDGGLGGAADIALLLKLTADQSIERMASRNGGGNRLDALDLKTKKRIAKAYDTLFDETRDNGRVIDAMMSEEAVTDAIVAAILEQVNQRRSIEIQPTPVDNNDATVVTSET